MTHAVVVWPSNSFYGIAACNARFWTMLLNDPHRFSLGRGQRMTESAASIDCMTCLVCAPAYDEACTAESPPTNEIA